MKATKIAIVIIFAGLCLSVSFARTSDQQLMLAKKSYLCALKSENHGVRSSAMLQIAKIKRDYPEENFQTFINEIEKISKNDPLVINRMYAHLVLVYLNNPRLAIVVNPKDYENPSGFFNEFYAQITNNQVALN